MAGGRFPALTVSPQPFIPDNEGDSVDLSRALKLVKELISSINEEVHTCEMNARLWDVYRRVDGRAKVQLPWESRAGVFGKDELLRRKLVHSGCMLWKTAAGRFKGGDQDAEGGPGCWGWRCHGMGILGDQGAKDWGTRAWGCPGTRVPGNGNARAWGTRAWGCSGRRVPGDGGTRGLEVPEDGAARDHGAKGWKIAEDEGICIWGCWGTGVPGDEGTWL